MKNPVFRVIRAFWLDGQEHQRGEVLKIADRAVALELLNAGRIEPENDSTMAQLQTRSLTKWEPVREAEQMGLRGYLVY